MDGPAKAGLFLYPPKTSSLYFSHLDAILTSWGSYHPSSNDSFDLALWYYLDNESQDWEPGMSYRATRLLIPPKTPMRIQIRSATTSGLSERDR